MLAVAGRRLTVLAVILPLLAVLAVALRWLGLLPLPVTRLTVVAVRELPAARSLGIAVVSALLVRVAVFVVGVSVPPRLARAGRSRPWPAWFGRARPSTRRRLRRPGTRPRGRFGWCRRRDRNDPWCVGARALWGLRGPLGGRPFRHRAWRRRRHEQRRSGDGGPRHTRHHSHLGERGGFKRSSQHLDREECCDGQRRRRRSDRAGRPAMRSPGRPPVGRRSIGSGSGRRSRGACRARTRRRRRACRRPVGVRWFREGGGMPSVTLAAAVGAVPVVRRARGDRAPARRWLRGARDRAPAGSVAVDDLAGAAAQRRDARRRPGVSGHDGAVACRPAGAASRSRRSSPSTTELRRYVQDRLAGAVSGPDGVAVAGPDVRVDRPAPRSPPGSALGAVVEPGADRQPAAARLPR